MKKDVYVVRHEGNWAVKRSGNSRSSYVLPTQKEAVAIARSVAKHDKVELRVQGRDRRFRECNSYGNDPCPPKDKNR